LGIFELLSTTVISLSLSSLLDSCSLSSLDDKITCCILSSFESILVISTSGGGGDSALRFLVTSYTIAVGLLERDSSDDKSTVYLIYI